MKMNPIPFCILLAVMTASLAGCSSSSIVTGVPRPAPSVYRPCRVADRPNCTRIYVDANNIVQSYIPQQPAARTSVYDIPNRTCPSPYDLP